MDIEKIAARATAVAFKVTESIGKKVTLRLKPESGAFNVETGKRGESTTPPIELSGRKYGDINAQRANDQTRRCIVLLQQSEVVAKGYVDRIDETDEAEIDGDKWQVDKVEADPASATYQLFCHR